jgi:hypothetical protein
LSPEHRLAIEIMSEWGKSPHEIVASDDWDVKPKLSEVEAILNPAEDFPAEARHYLVFAGVKQSIADWSLATGIPRTTINARLERGWTVQRTLTEVPTLHRRRA